MGMSVDSHLKSVVKGITWRIVGTLDTFVISTLVTGEIKIGASIALVEIFTKVFLYWLHERVWLRIEI